MSRNAIASSTPSAAQLPSAATMPRGARPADRCSQPHHGPTETLMASCEGRDRSVSSATWQRPAGSPLPPTSTISTGTHGTTRGPTCGPCVTPATLGGPRSTRASRGEDQRDRPTCIGVVMLCALRWLASQGREVLQQPVLKSGIHRETCHRVCLCGVWRAMSPSRYPLPSLPREGASRRPATAIGRHTPRSPHPARVRQVRDAVQAPQQCSEILLARVCVHGS